MRCIEIPKEDVTKEEAKGLIETWDVLKYEPDGGAADK